MDVPCVNNFPKEQTINLTHLKLFIISMKKVFFYYRNNVINAYNFLWRNANFTILKKFYRLYLRVRCYDNM